VYGARSQSRPTAIFFSLGGAHRYPCRDYRHGRFLFKFRYHFLHVTRRKVVLDGRSGVIYLTSPVVRALRTYSSLYLSGNGGELPRSSSNACASVNEA
jgi:hypothetical protein